MDQEPKRRFYLHHFKSISHAIATYEDLGLLFNHLAEGTARAFDAKGCAIMLLDEREKQFFHVSSYGISESYKKKGPIFIDQNHSAFFVNKPVFIKDMLCDNRIRYPEDAKKEGLVSLLCIPIRHRKDPIGLVRIYHAESIEYHEEDIDALSVLCELLGMVIDINGLINFLDSVKIAMGSLPIRMLAGL